MVRYFSAFIVASQILLTTAAPTGDCPRRLKRQNGALIQGEADLVGENVQDGALQVGNGNFFGDGIDGGGQGELATADFGPFFSDDIINGDLGGFFSTEGAGGGEGGGIANTELGGAQNRAFSNTGVGVRLVASFTVTDLATIVTDGSLAILSAAAEAKSLSSVVASPAPTAAPALGTSAASAQASSVLPSSSAAVSEIGSRVANQGNPSSGVGFRVVTIESVGSDAVASATLAASSEINAAGGSVSATQVASAPPPASASASSSSAGASFVPTTTGVAAQQLGFATTSTSIDFAALSSSIAGSSPSTSPLAATEQQAAVQIPGQKLSVLPIGLGVFGGLALLALLVVGYVTYERKKYRKQFRNRKATENVQNATILGARAWASFRTRYPYPAYYRP